MNIFDRRLWIRFWQIARSLLTQPRYAVLDEATSALDVSNEGLLYVLLRQTGTTYVSVGHRPSLLSFHDRVLELRGKGEWRVAPASEYLSSAPAYFLRIAGNRSHPLSVPT